MVNHHTSLAVKIHQFTCISTNTHISMQKKMEMRCSSTADTRRIAVRFLNVQQNHIMCPVRLQGVVFTGVR